MKLKAFRIAIIVAVFFISGFLCLSMVSALGSNEATASVRWSKTSPSPGETVTITLSFENKLQKQIQVARIGINADWMPPDSAGNPVFAGPQYTSNPVTVAAGDTFTSETFSLTIPSTAKAGIYTYYIAVDGYDSTGAGFSWDSQRYSITLGNSNTASSTPGPSATNSDTNTNNPQIDTLTLIAAITITGVIAVIVVALFMSRRKGQPATPATNNQTWPLAPPKEEPSESQQNFDI